MQRLACTQRPSCSMLPVAMCHMSCGCSSRETPKQAATPDALGAEDVPPAAVVTAEAAPAEARDLHSSRETHFEKRLGGSERSHCRGLRHPIS